MWWRPYSLCHHADKCGKVSMDTISSILSESGSDVKWSLFSINCNTKKAIPL